METYVLRCIQLFMVYFININILWTVWHTGVLQQARTYTLHPYKIWNGETEQKFILKFFSNHRNAKGISVEHLHVILVFLALSLVCFFFLFIFTYLLISLYTQFYVELKIVRLFLFSSPFSMGGNDSQAKYELDQTESIH